MKAPPELIYSTILASPIGHICLRASNTHLLALEHENQIEKSPFTKYSQNTPSHPLLTRAVTQLQEYFESQRQEFDIPLNPKGTDFQKQVWAELKRIPYGKTISYQQLAEQIKNPKAVRAVGLANGRNPISIFIPCHRVIGKSGKLTGYAGGLGQKKILLKIENNNPNTHFQLE